MLEIRHVDSEAGWSLAKRLEAAKLAGTRELRSGLEYHFRTNEMAANMALNLFAEWLRERGMDGSAKRIIEGQE